jgi:RNA binding exosome subunit
MSFVAKVEARAYSRATEISERVVTAILNLYPENFRDSVKFETTKVEGQSGDEILIVEATLEDKVGSEETLDFILRKFEERDCRRLQNSLARRLDKNCLLFIRIDKQEAFLDNIVLARDPDVISVQIHIRQYPRCRFEDAMKMLEDRLRAVGGDV